MSAKYVWPDYMLADVKKAYAGLSEGVRRDVPFDAFSDMVAEDFLGAFAERYAELEKVEREIDQEFIDGNCMKPIGFLGHAKQ